MNAATHDVAPEDVMALLDGELGDAERQRVSLHIETCAECAVLAEQLRGASESLSAWIVPEARAELPAGIESRPRRAVAWKWALIGSGSVLAMLFLAFAVLPGSRSVPLTHYERASDSVRYVEPQMPLAQDTGVVAGQLTGSRTKAPAPPPPPPVADVAPAAAPMIARTASLSVVVKQFDSARAAVDKILDRHHGYWAQLSVNTPENAARTLQGSVRIPAPQLAAALADLRNIGRVQTESQSGEEVTSQHADLVARLKNSRNTEERLTAILRQRTGTLSDVLEVEETIARVRAEIEQMEAEQKALEHRVDFASVELQISEEYKAALNPPSTSFSTRLHNAFVDGYRNASEMIVSLILFVLESGPTILLFLLIIVLPAILLWRRYRRFSSSI